ncbi:MAG: hypothetical protein KatS3mg131_3430 [Candidatus Tectimicrobiota bacterium]|nr:MAG: hypothetical protein KatS3mg131_3430 [Candidatus Tectomicrobia bacterium]
MAQRRVSLRVVGLVGGVAFVLGVLAHYAYEQWRQRPAGRYPVTYAPAPPQELPLVAAEDVVRLRELAGTEARVRGRIFRVGYSARSNTYFLNFGPAREDFTAVIFASAVPAFTAAGIDPRTYEGKTVEVRGRLRDHPRYGLEMALETPDQIRLLE